MPFTPFKKGHQPVKKKTTTPMTPPTPMNGPMPPTPMPPGQGPMPGPFQQALNEVMQKKGPPAKKAPTKRRKKHTPPKPPMPTKTGY